jgi:hypothetical protein
MLAKLLRLAVVLEIATGLAMIVDPALVVTLLAGKGDAGEAMPLARFPGIALVALGLACWPAQWSAAGALSAWRGMLFYNAGVALFLAWLFFVGHIGGILLWPGVVLHAIMAALLVRARPKAE